MGLLIFYNQMMETVMKKKTKIGDLRNVWNFEARYQAVYDLLIRKA